MSTKKNFAQSTVVEVISCTFLSSTKRPPEPEKFYYTMPDQKTRIFQIPPTPHEDNSGSHDSNSHPSALLKNLLQSGDNPQTSAIQAGQIIRDTYSLECKIGRGGMGQVWKALDLIQDAGDAKDKHVAVKFINHEIRNHPYALKALVREFARYKKLIHPNIVKAYELNRDGNEIFILNPA